VAGDSMSPTLNIGDLVLFEYHRTSRRRRFLSSDHYSGPLRVWSCYFARNKLSAFQLLPIRLPEFGPATDGTEAIKRLTQELKHLDVHENAACCAGISW
jgi:hypothetical protein